jgi:hypothetical protein
MGCRIAAVKNLRRLACVRAVLGTHAVEGDAGQSATAPSNEAWFLLKFSVAIATLSAVLLAHTICFDAAPVRAQEPDWPCQQRLVPTLSAAAYWSGLLPDRLGDWRTDTDAADLVRRIGPRQVSTEAGLTEIAAFARTLSRDREPRIRLVFLGLLEQSNEERRGVIEELQQIGRRQRELARLVGRLAAELNAIPPDAAGEAAAKRADLQERHDFTARNFEEIQRTIRYACEIPVALDARLGAWARALQAAVSG